MKFENLVQDEFGQEHKITRKLGDGGQGIVYETTNPDIAIKFELTKLTREPLVNKSEIEAYHNKLDSLLTLPLDSNINIARPICRLKHHAGYVMQKLQNMQPIENLIAKKNPHNKTRKFPEWLKDLAKNSGGEAAWVLEYYASTGSTKKRLEVLMEFANQLCKLHGLGLVYADISPANIFYSSSSEFNHIWLIDGDNLRFDNNSKNSVITPGYGAPEVCLGLSGSTCSSDCYSFAVLAFKLLSLLHPFDGQRLTSQGGWDDSNSTQNIPGTMDAMQQSESGLLPYIDDPDDDSNSNNAGLPRSLVLTDELVKLFHQTLSLAQKETWKRPAIYHWPIALAKAADNSIHCNSCNMSFYEKLLSENSHCPYCEEKIKEYLITDRTPLNKKSDEKGDQTIWHSVHSLSDNEIILKKRNFIPFSSDNYNDEFARLTKEDGIWLLTLTPDLTLTSQIAENKPDVHFKNFSSKIELSISDLQQGIVIQVAGKQPQQTRIMIKSSAK